MTTYNTKDPLGSASVKNLYDNSENLDKAVNDRKSEFWSDRFGNERISWHGMEMQNARLIEKLNNDMQKAILAAGYAPIGTFQGGAEVKNVNEVVLWRKPDGDGEYYRCDGDLPKSVPENSTPESTGGIKTTDNPSGLWVSVGDAALRSDLKNNAGSSLVTYTNPNGPAIPMPVDVRIGQTYSMSDFGVSAKATAAENTARINATLNALSGKSYISQFIFDLKGSAYINGSIITPNNTDIKVEVGTHLINVAGTNRPIFISEHWFATIANPSDLSKKSDYLGIHGGGEINYNKFGTAPGGLNTHAICIAGVKRLKLGGGLKVGGAFKYAYLVANVDYLDAQSLQFDNESDGLHLQPPIYHAYVRNLQGHTGDDLFAMTGGDYDSYDLGTRGNFHFIDVEGLFNDNTLCAVKLAGNDGVEFKHVSVKGIHGTCKNAPIRIWADHNLTNTVVKHASFDEISAIPRAGYALCELFDRGLGKVSVDQVSVKNISTNLTALGTPIIDVRSSVDLIAYNIDMDVPRNARIGFSCGNGEGNDKSRIFNINIDAKNTALSSDQYSSLCLVTRGVVDNVNMKGGVEHKAAATLCQQRGGTLKNITISDTTYANGHIFRQFAANIDGSTPTVHLNNLIGTTSGKLALFHKGGRVSANNVTLLSSGSGLIETTEAGIVDIYGSINHGQSLIPSEKKTGFEYRAFGFGLTVDAENLQRTGTQMCNNINASFGAGVGLIAYATGSGWKNLITGATA
ncbi:hypothetical protein RI835_000998 [Providencia rettgeri]|nr:hypothetical protein [Providencia rettgeri]